MQLKLALLESTEPLPSSVPASPPLPTTAWDQLDEAARVAALHKLAVLIARMLATEPAEEVGNE
jgi:hypothetical protein